VARDGISLLDALREDLRVTAVKDGCSPQGQCGCCTVLVDGVPRVSCVTALRRVAGRDVRTVDGLDEEVKGRLVEAFVDHGASQCGFCTPGILCRLAALNSPTAERVETALLAHLCRCTGWRSIVDAAVTGRCLSGDSRPAASLRAALEGGSAQQVGPDVVLGRGGFADDTAPAGCLVAVPDGAGGWAVGETLDEARRAAGKVQGRRSGQALTYPVEVPEGRWDITLQTTWVEPAYLEPDASWCVPGGTPASPAANGGDFGAKRTSLAPDAARRLADEYGRPVRVVFSREDAVRMGAKRPPAGGGINLDGTGVLRLAAGAPLPTVPGIFVEEVAVPGPAVSPWFRAAGWAEAAVLSAAARSHALGLRSATVESVSAGVTVDHRLSPVRVELEVDAGDPLDLVTLRSYVMGAAHMALGWVCSEGIAVDENGVPQDLTIRSFGILRAKETPPIDMTFTGADGEPKKVSDAVFAAVAAATWLAQGLPPRWPTLRA
jgi:xanthine dehydrogenase small subunit